MSYPIEGGWFELSFLLSSMGKSPTIKIRLNEYNQYEDKINSRLVSCLLIGVYFNPDLYEHDLEMFAVGKIFQMKSPKLTIQLSNGEVFTCPSGLTSIKAGYALLGESVSVNFGACNLMSTKSPSNRIDRTKYVLRQLSTYNIVAVTIDDCSFKVKGESDKLLNSAPTFAEMCKQMKFKITYKQCFEF